MAPPNWSLLLIMVCFWLVYLAVTTQLVNPLGRIMDERVRRVSEARRGFEDAQASLDEAIARSEKEVAAAAAEAQRERNALRSQGEASRRAKLDEARQAAADRLGRFSAELATASDDARREMRERSRLLGRELAEQLLGRRIAS